MEPNGPPEPPRVARRLRFSVLQVLGVSVLASIPTLALFGFFGESRDTAEAVGPGTGIGLEVEYPTRLRYRQLAQVMVTVRNQRGVALDSVTVRFDGEYVARFSQPSLLPPPTQPFAVTLGGVPAGGTERVLLQLTADRYGRHNGAVRVSTGGDTAVVDMTTFVFP